MDRASDALWNAAVEVVESEMELSKAVDLFKNYLLEVVDEQAKSRKKEINAE